MLPRTRVGLAYRFLVDLVRDEDGGPLVEFTVLLPIFLLIMFGIIQWGNIFFVQNNMLIAARQAARSVAVGTVADTSAAAIAAACGTTSAPTPITGSSYTYTFTFSYNTNCTGASSPANPTYGNVSLTISTPASAVSIINYLGLIGSGANLSASATLQQEYVCPAAAGVSTATQKC